MIEGNYIPNTLGDHLTNRQVLPLFPSNVFRGNLKDEALVDKILEKVMKLKEENAGSSQEGYFVTDDMLQNDPDFKDLVNVVMEESEHVLNYYHVKRDSHYITNMWANVSKPNSRHQTHVHPNCLLVGLLYLKTPKKCGPTTFFDPRPAAGVIKPQMMLNTIENADMFRHEAEKGVMLFWNSWLPHSVEVGFCEEDEDRVTIAFNIMIKGEINIKTAHLVL